MAKQSLGRDLGTLMGRNPKLEEAPVSEGVRSLMRGNNPPAPAPAPAPQIIAPAVLPAAPKSTVPRWYLLAGDVLLVALALITIFYSPHPLSWPRALFCAGMVLLAAILAVMALLTPGGRKP
jgi:hypothetical protein